jgi:hypothetical protein
MDLDKNYRVFGESDFPESESMSRYGNYEISGREKKDKALRKLGLFNRSGTPFYVFHNEKSKFLNKWRTVWKSPVKQFKHATVCCISGMLIACGYDYTWDYFASAWILGVMSQNTILRILHMHIHSII